jgi:hypothetical protein
MAPRASITTSAEPGLNFRDLGQLLRRELAFQGINRLHEVLRVAAPFDRIVGKSPRMREGLVRLAVRGGAGAPIWGTSMRWRRRRGFGHQAIAAQLSLDNLGHRQSRPAHRRIVGLAPSWRQHVNAGEGDYADNFRKKSGSCCTSTFAGPHARRLALPPLVLACPNVSPRAKFLSKCYCW